MDRDCLPAARSASAFAQGGSGQGGSGVAWHELSPEQQQALAPLRERWDALPPAGSKPCHAAPSAGSR